MSRSPFPLPAEREVAGDHEYLFAGHAASLAAAWWSQAQCRDIEPELFFPASTRDLLTRRIALRVCEACPVKLRCLDVALADRSLVGIWGDTDEEQRRELRRSEAGWRSGSYSAHD